MISWNLPLLIRETTPQAEVFPSRKNKPCYGIRIPGQEEFTVKRPYFDTLFSENSVFL
jgi:hypothetical protein